MSPKPTNSGGTPPVCEDGFGFSNGDFFAEASGQNRHCRASAVELAQHFENGTAQDHPAHWFEAQLLHYGLKSSKVKGTARMRLFDAFKEGNLSVPTHIGKLEQKLKREWAKKNKEAQTRKPAELPNHTAGVASESKRKATAVAELTEPTTKKGKAADSGTSDSTNGATTISKAKTDTKADAKQSGRLSSASASTLATPAATTSAPTRQIAASGHASSGVLAGTPMASQESTNARPKPTAQRGGISKSGSTHGSVTPAPSISFLSRSSVPARRGAQYNMGPRVRTDGHTPQWRYWTSSYDQPPKPYYAHDDWLCDSASEDGRDVLIQPTLAPLGPINGRYRIQSDFMLLRWTYSTSDFNLVLATSGRKLWGRFSLGVISGVMFFPDRPMKSSLEYLPFTWRGRNDEGELQYGDGHEGYMRFLGGGRIEAQVEMMSIKFEGKHHEGQGIRSPVPVKEMQSEWDTYVRDSPGP